MTKNAEKTRPLNGSNHIKDREISITDGIVCAQNKKELSFEDTAITFRQIGGTWRISLRQLAEYYDVPFKQASRKLTSNSDLFRDLVTGAVTAPVKGTVFDYELSISTAVFLGVVFFPILSLYLMYTLHIDPSFELQVVLSYLAIFAIITIRTYLISCVR